MKENDYFSILEDNISKERKAVNELRFLFNNLKSASDKEEREMVLSQIKSLRTFMKKTNEDVKKELEGITTAKPLHNKKIEEKGIKEKTKKSVKRSKKIPKEIKPTELEKQILKRIKRKTKDITIEEEKKPSKYINISNKVFSGISRQLAKKDMFNVLKKDLMKTNLQFTSSSYISIILFSTMIAAVFGFFVFGFFLFFKFENFPIVALVEGNILMRIPQTFWILFAVPIATFIFMYLYPSLEKKSSENKINQELPFATIHMATISGSMVEPSKIFSIIISTGEYPNLKKEFTKLINFVNIYGYNLVTALRMTATNSPSKKLTDLLNSLSVTITSGGSLPNFFEKRSQSLLFEYKLEREKYTKTAETFMDVYISVVIAAPMMLMLLLMIMRVSGLGISLSGSMISLIMVLGISLINVIFLIFLHFKQPGE